MMVLVAAPQAKNTISEREMKKTFMIVVFLTNVFKSSLFRSFVENYDAQILGFQGVSSIFVSRLWQKNNS